MQSNDTTTSPQQHVGSTAELDQDPFRGWVVTLTVADRFEFDSEGRGYKKETMAMMRMAWNASQAAERERICAAIKAEDDHCADGDYMMDSDDCIKVVRGTWERPDWNGSNSNLSNPRKV